MGRTNSTYRDRLSSLEREWGDYRRALRTAEQPHFDHLFEHGREYAHAAGYLNHPTPEIPLLVSILLAHERELARLRDRVDELAAMDGQRAETTDTESNNGVQD